MAKNGSKPTLRPGVYARLMTLDKGMTLSNTGDVSGGGTGGVLIIDLPTMPESVDLNRTSRYEVTTPMNLPDGIHIFQNTDPMEIPFSFKLAAFDTYCTQGGYTLIDIGAKLHAMSLPVRSAADIAQGGSVYTFGKTVAKTPTDTKGEPTPQQKAEAGPKSSLSSNSLVIPNFPPVCFLRLISIAKFDKAGVACVGYVKAVTVKLKGPWLVADDGSYNIPSFGEYGFTFVNAPTYRNEIEGNANSFNAGGNSNANSFSQDVEREFYNTFFNAAKGGIGGMTSPQDTTSGR